MQDNENRKSYDYFLAFIQEAIKENIFPSKFIEEHIRKIAREEFLLLSARKKAGILTEQGLLISKISWLKSNSSLFKLHSLLISHGFIACKYETFKAHFTEGEAICGPLEWLTYTKWLLYLFDQLIANGFILSHKNLHQVLKKHFLDKHGKKFTNGCLRSSLNNLRNNKRVEIMEKIVNDLIKMRD